MTLDPEIRRDALKMLAAREHSRNDLERKLHARGYALSAVREVLEDLCGRGLLSEARMAEAYVAERVRKGFGPLRVRQELRSKGLADALIQPALAKSTREWLDLMTAAHDRKFGPERTADPRELTRRARFLEYRGFPAELIGRFLFDDRQI